MMQKPWFKVIIWIIASAFFFITSVMVISACSPPPSEQQSMQFMAGMMGAMHSSLMGLSMSLESDGTLKAIINTSARLFLPLVLAAVFAAILLSFRENRDAR
ncbi:MAG: hypothetical protein ACM3PP_08200 [Candidatus Saccharibacteria bacterium]